MQSGDLITGGRAALSVTQVDARTFSFEIDPAVGATEGEHSVYMAAGAIADLAGLASTAFSGSFIIDKTGPRLVGSSIAEGNVLTGGQLVYTATFDEPLDPTRIDITDFALNGDSTGAIVSAGFQYNAAANALTLRFDDLPDDQYTLTLRGGNTANLVDRAGNPFDGEVPPNLARWARRDPASP